MTESVECRPCVQEMRILDPGRVKPIAYQIDTCRFLAWFSASIGQGKDWLVNYQDNVTEWDIGSQCQWPDFPQGSTTKSL